MQVFRAFVKSRIDIAGKSVTNALFKVKSFNIKRDLLSKVTSDIELLEMPTLINLGDIVGVYDEYGRVIYAGVITNVTSKIQSDQIIGLFDDEHVYSITDNESIEESIKQFMTNELVDSTDPIIKQTFSSFDIVCDSTTSSKLATQEANTTFNLSSFLYDLYKQYQIITDVQIFFEEKKPIIRLFKSNAVQILLSNNAIQILSVATETTVQDTNKLIIYSSEGVYRETWYLSANGVTNNPNDLSRMNLVKTAIEFSDDEIDTIVNSKLTPQLFNHEIKVNMSLLGKLYDFFSFELGQQFKLFDGSKYYDTILTGYQLQYSNFALSEVILTFGMVRISLENKLYGIIK